MDFDSLKEDAPSKVSAFDALPDDEERYGGTTGALKAFGLGAARSASFGLSDEFLVRSGAMKPEDLKAYKETNPIATPVGEFAGVVGALALGPESAAAKGAASVLEATGASAKAIKAAKSAANSSLRGFEAADLLNPVRTVTRAGASIVGAAPEATTTVGKILSQAGAYAAGSAVEGAAYGLGQSVTEHALGDPELNGEKVLANVGTAALTGGALGSVFGAVKGTAKAVIPKFLSEVDKAAIDAGDWAAMAKGADLPEAESKGFVEGLRRKKANASEIEKAAQEIGAPLLPSMTSDSKLVHEAQAALLEGPPSYSAMRAQNLAVQGFERAESAASSTLGSSDLTKANLGDVLKGMVTDSVERQSAPINALYDELKTYYQAIPTSEKSIKQIARNIRNLEDVPLSPQARSIAESAAERLESVKTIDDVKRLRSILNQELGMSATPIQKRVTAVIADKLADLEENSLVRFAKKEMKTSQAKDKIMGLLDQREATNAQYSVFKDKIQRMGEVLGRKRVHGAQDFLDFISDMTPEKIADKLGGKNNSEFLSWFAKEMPDGMQAISQYQKGMIRETAMRDGKLNIGRLLSEVDKLPKEFRDKVFTPEELQKLAAVKTYWEAFPKKFNPSGTANMTAFRAFFEHPVGAAVANARDIGIEGFLGAATGAGERTAAFVDGLATLERTAQKTGREITRGAAAIFNRSDDSPGKAYLAISGDESRNDHDRMHASLTDLQSSPEKLIDHLSQNTEALAEVAPNTSASVQAAAARAAQFLHSKLPGADMPSAPLSAQYQPSRAELAKWHRYFNVVERPTSALSDVARGTLTKETMETLMVVYPKMLTDMRAHVADKMVDAVAKGRPIPYRTKLSLSLFMGHDLVSSLKPQNILVNQNVQASATAAKQGREMAQMTGVNKQNLGNMERASSMMTPAQKSAARGGVNGS